MTRRTPGAAPRPSGPRAAARYTTQTADVSGRRWPARLGAATPAGSDISQTVWHARPISGSCEVTEDVRAGCYRRPIDGGGCTSGPVASATEGVRFGEARLRDGGSGVESGQGPHGLVARATPQEPRTPGDDAEARPVHQRRPGHDEPLPARRGVRHRRQGRDRPRPRPLRTLRRRGPHPQVERDDRLDLPVGARQGAQGRVPRRDRAGDPAHHQRDQGAHPRARQRRRRRRDHRDRRHRRRHRDPPVPRGDPAVPQGRRPRQRLLRARHAGAVHRPVGASRRPSRRSTRSPSCAAGASSPTRSCAAATVRSPSA